MTDNERIPVLIVSADGHLVHQIVQKIRARFSRLPIDTDLFEDGRRALGEFKQRRHCICIVGEELPGMDGADLVRELRKIDGSISVLFLRAHEDELPEGVDAVTLPIVDWTDFLSRFQAAIPDDWKARFGLFERNSVLYDKLVEYGRRYRIDLPQDRVETTEPLVCIPKFFDEAPGASVQAVSNGGSSVRERIVFKEVTAEQRRKVLKIELVVLGCLTAASLGVFFLRPESSEGLLSLKPLLLAITAFSYFGFFLGHAFDRFVLSRKAGHMPGLEREGL